MNIHAADATLTIHFSAAKIARVDEVESGIRVAYDRDQRIVDVVARARAGTKRVDIGEGNTGERPQSMTYDPSYDLLYICASNAKIEGTEEVLPDFIVDFDAEGFVKGLEFLNASGFFSDQTMAAIRNSATLL